MVDTDSEGRVWDWLGDVDDVIVRGQPAIACYLNPAGDIVLRQHGDYFDDDAWIWFAAEQAPTVAAAILEAAGFDPTTLTPESARVGSGAERQKRYRERKKKESTPEPDIFARDVTDGRDTVTRNGGTRDGNAA